MSELGYLLFLSLIGSVFSLLGGVLLLIKRKLAESISHLLASFAAGALLGTALFDLLPESLDQVKEIGSTVHIGLWVLFGILIFYFLERGIHWFYFHRSQKTHTIHKRPTVALIMFGDSMHNFIDGVAIAITFLVNPGLGVITTLAVAAHEIPQEIGDFAVMLHEGISRKKVLLMNLFSALLAMLGAVITYYIGQSIEALLPYALALTTGFFLYIALASLIPEIHHEEKKGYAFFETLFLVLGVVTIYVSVLFLEGSH